MTAELSLDEVRSVQIDILREFDRVCRSQGLIYYLAYGTLLGAIRHDGYIPWDDDVDVMMPRADYDRLSAVFAAAAPAHLSVSSPQTRTDWPFPYAKVGDDRTELWEPLEEPLPLGVNLDVFPIDVLPTGQLARRVQAQLLRLLRWAVELRYIAAERGREWHHPIAISVGKPILRRVPARLLVAAFTRVATAGGRNGTRAGVLVGSFEWSVNPHDLGTPVDVTFEQLSLLAPAEAAGVLTTVYGDYTSLPPEAERISHHAFTASWKASGDAG